MKKVKTTAGLADEVTCTVAFRDFLFMGRIFDLKNNLIV